MALTKVDLTNTVTGTLPVANGGTGATSLSGANLAVTNATNTFTVDQSISGLTVGKGAGAVSGNTAFGYQAINSGSSSGADNTAVGFVALNANTTGVSNSSYGSNSLSRNTTGSYNTALGKDAMPYNTTASNNTAVGYQAGYSNTTAAYNTFFGTQAGYNITGGSNTVIGYQSGFNITSGTNNTHIGNTSGAQSSTSTGSFNTSVGDSSLGRISSGNYNVAIGPSALVYNTTASNNTAVGYQAGYSNSIGGYNTFVGTGAGFTANPASAINTFNTFIGAQAGYYCTTGTYNTFVGPYSSGSAVTTGGKNTILGGYNGNQGSLDIRTASNYIVLSDGDGNPRFYIDNNGQSTWGTYSTSGASDGKVISPSGTDCRMGSSVKATTGQYHFTFYNPNGYVGSIQTSGTATQYLTSSDYRLKENVAPMAGALDKVALLKPVTYKWKTDGADGQGFIAHELQAVIPDAVTGKKDDVDEEGNPVYQSVDTSFLVATLTAAIQELKAEFDAYKAEHP